MVSLCAIDFVQKLKHNYLKISRVGYTLTRIEFNMALSPNVYEYLSVLKLCKE